MTDEKRWTFAELYEEAMRAAREYEVARNRESAALRGAGHALGLLASLLKEMELREHPPEGRIIASGVNGDK